MLSAIGIVSKDLEQSTQFYSILGVQFESVGGEDHWEATLPNGMRLMLDSVSLVRKLNPNWQRPTGSGVVLCFSQSTPQEVDALYSQIVEQGYESLQPPWDAFWGQRYASVQDPDGNQIDLFATLVQFE